MNNQTKRPSFLSSLLILSLLAVCLVYATGHSPLAPKPVTFVGAWRVQHFLWANSPEPVTAEFGQWIEFSSDGFVSYSDGCNHRGGTYKASSPGTLSIGFSFQTMLYCSRCDKNFQNCVPVPPEDQDLPWHTTEVSWEIQGRELTLYLDAHRTKLVQLHYISPLELQERYGYRALYWRRLQGATSQDLALNPRD